MESTRFANKVAVITGAAAGIGYAIATLWAKEGGKAIVADKVIDGSKCISYATIELKDQIPDFFKDKMEDWMFGCDICQDVCPWNRFSAPTLEEKFRPNSAVKNFTKQEWKDITREIFSSVFKKSALMRTKFSGLKRNIDFLSE